MKNIHRELKKSTRKAMRRQHRAGNRPIIRRIIREGRCVKRWGAHSWYDKIPDGVIHCPSIKYERGNTFYE